MDDMLRRAICDYFEAGDFAEYIGVTVDDAVERGSKLSGEYRLAWCSY